jgi:hypothetical protein
MSYDRVYQKLKSVQDKCLYVKFYRSILFKPEDPRNVVCGKCAIGVLIDNKQLDKLDDQSLNCLRINHFKKHEFSLQVLRNLMSSYDITESELVDLQSVNDSFLGSPENRYEHVMEWLERTIASLKA